MTVERGLRLMAGVMVLLSLALAHYFSLYWLWLTVFAGLNLFSRFHQLVSRHGYPSRHRTQRCQIGREVVRKLCAPGTEADEFGMRCIARCSGWKKPSRSRDGSRACLVACLVGR